MMQSHGAHHEKKEEKFLYMKQILGFYFAPLLRSFLTVLYLLFFLYFAVYYVNNVVISIKFVIYTLVASNFNWSLSHLFWGALFAVTLIVPFSLSVYAILIPFEVKKAVWDRKKKFLMIALVVVATIDIIVLMNYAIRGIEGQEPARTFLLKEGIVRPDNQP